MLLASARFSAGHMSPKDRALFTTPSASSADHGVLSAFRNCVYTNRTLLLAKRYSNEGKVNK